MMSQIIVIQLGLSWTHNPNSILTVVEFDIKLTSHTTPLPPTTKICNTLCQFNLGPVKPFIYLRNLFLWTYDHLHLGSFKAWITKLFIINSISGTNIDFLPLYYMMKWYLHPNCLVPVHELSSTNDHKLTLYSSTYLFQRIIKFRTKHKKLVF